MLPSLAYYHDGDYATPAAFVTHPQLGCDVTQICVLATLGGRAADHFGV